MVRQRRRHRELGSEINAEDCHSFRSNLRLAGQKIDRGLCIQMRGIAFFPGKLEVVSLVAALTPSSPVDVEHGDSGPDKFLLQTVEYVAIACSGMQQHDSRRGRAVAKPIGDKKVAEDRPAILGGEGNLADAPKRFQPRGDPVADDILY